MKQAVGGTLAERPRFELQQTASSAPCFRNDMQGQLAESEVWWRIQTQLRQLPVSFGTSVNGHKDLCQKEYGEN